MQRVELPNEYKVACVNDFEPALMYIETFITRSYLQHGVSVSPGDVVFDVGANIGMASLFFQSECSDIVIHAFEPAPRTFLALQENLTDFKVPATARRAAVAKEPGTAQFTFYPNCTILSGLHADPAEAIRHIQRYFRNMGLSEHDVESFLVERYLTETVECEVTTVSQEIEEQRVDQIDLLKIDVEKSELDVLMGVEDAHWPKVRQVVAEVHDIAGRLRAATSLLERHGFRVVVDQDPLLEGTEVHQVFAVRP